MQAEYFDLPGRPADETAKSYRELDRLNRLFYFSHPFVSRLPNWLGRDKCRRLEILDVGAGTGLLGRKMSRWAARRGWEWNFTNVDTNPMRPRENDPARHVTGSALELPFADDTFDLVVASQMTHHLSPEEIVQHWREAWRVSRDGIFISDLHRNAGLYTLVWLTTTIIRTKPQIKQDGLISVKRGFRCPEWQQLAAAANIPSPRVSLYYGTRIILQARKAASAASARCP